MCTGRASIKSSTGRNQSLRLDKILVLLTIFLLSKSRHLQVWWLPKIELLILASGQRVYIEVIHQQAENIHVEPIEIPFILGLPGGPILVEELYKTIASRVLQDYNPKTTSIKGITTHSFFFFLSHVPLICWTGHLNAILFFFFLTQH